MGRINVDGHEIEFEGDTLSDEQKAIIERDLPGLTAPPPLPVPGARVAPVEPRQVEASGGRIIERSKEARRRKIKEDVRLAAMGTLGVAGSIAGTKGIPQLGGLLAKHGPTAARAVAGPVGRMLFNPAAGSVGGGSIGVAAGSVTTDAYAQLGDALGVFPSFGKHPTPSTIMKTAAKEAMLDMVIGTSVLGATGGGRFLLGGVLGVQGAAGRQVARTMLDMSKEFFGKPTSLAVHGADQLGIRVGAASVSEFRAVSRFPRVLGKFPMFAGIFRRQFIQSADDIARSRLILMDNIAPQVGVANIGIDLTAAARNTVMRGGGTFPPLDEIARLYDDFWTDAVTSNARIPTGAARQEAAALTEEIIRRRPPIEMTKGGVKTVKGLPPIGSARVRNYIAKLQNLADDMSPEQYKGLLEDLNDMAAAAGKSGNQTDLRRITRLKQALELDLEDIQGPAEVITKLKKANAAYTETMDFLSQPTAQKFRRTSRDIFKRKGVEMDFSEGASLPAAGPTSADKMFKVVFDSESPQAMAHLHKITASQPEVFRAALRRHLDEVFEPPGKAVPKRLKLDVGGREVVIPDVPRIRRELGLTDPQSAKYATLKAALALGGQGLTPGMLDDFLQAAGRVELPPDAAEFVARRAILGGAGAIITAVSMGLGGAGAGLVSLGMMVSVIMATRSFSKLISNPDVLRKVTIALAPTASQSVRRTAVARLAQLYGRDLFGVVPPGPSQQEIQTQAREAGIIK